MLLAALVGAVAAAVLLRVRHPRHHHRWHRASSPSVIHAVAPAPEATSERGTS
jgi:hypothetical protein